MALEVEARWKSYLWKAVLSIYDEKAGLSAATVSYLEAMSRVEIGEAGLD